MHRPREQPPHPPEQGEDKARRVLGKGSGGTSPHIGRMAERPASERKEAAHEVQRIPEARRGGIHQQEVSELERRQGGRRAERGGAHANDSTPQQPRQHHDSGLLQQGGGHAGLGADNRQHGGRVEREARPRDGSGQTRRNELQERTEYAGEATETKRGVPYVDAGRLGLRAALPDCKGRRARPPRDHLLEPPVLGSGARPLLRLPDRLRDRHARNARPHH